MNVLDFIELGKREGWLHSTGMQEEHTVGSHRSKYDIYDVRIDRLKYNVRNGRIATALSRELQDGKSLPDDIDQLNNLIQKFIYDDNPERTKKTMLDMKSKGQQRVAVILSDGTVIDGNRRFTCLRMIQDETGSLQYLRCFILPEQTSEIDIKALELELQFGEDEKLPYDPIDRLVDVNEWVLSNKMDAKLYFGQCGITSQAEIKHMCLQAELMIEFLNKIGKPGQYHAAKDLKIQGPLHELASAIKKCGDEDLAETMKNATFAIIMAGSGDTTREVRAACAALRDDKTGTCEEEQRQIALSVFEIISSIPDCASAPIGTIRDTIREDKQLVAHQIASIEKAKHNTKCDQVKSSQGKCVESAIRQLRDVDVDVLGTLGKNDLQKIRANLDEAIVLARQLKDTIDSIL